MRVKGCAKMLKLLTIKTIGLGLVFLLTGCAASTTDYRVEGFRLATKSFNTISESPGLYEVVEIKNIKVHIVGDRSRFLWDWAAAYGSPIDAYSTTNNEIYIRGKRLGNKIVVNQAVLGHELNHLLNFKNPKIADPDEYGRLEQCSAKNLFGNEC